MIDAQKARDTKKVSTIIVHHCTAHDDYVENLFCYASLSGVASKRSSKHATFQEVGARCTPGDASLTSHSLWGGSVSELALSLV